MALKDALKRLPEDKRGDLGAPSRAPVLREIAARLGRTEAAARKLWLRGPERLEQERKPSP